MKRFSVILIMLGIIVALMPVAGQLYNSYSEERMIEEWLANSESTSSPSLEVDSKGNSEEDYASLQDAFTDDSSQVDANVYQEVYPGVASAAYNSKNPLQKSGGIRSSKNRNTSNFASQKILGAIKISKIDVYLPVVEGAGRSQLRTGIGHFPGTAGLGKNGNCVLAGHRNYAFAKFFNRLNELKKGDKVTLITRGAEYNYEVYARYIVTPKDVSVLRGNKNKNIVTLITCTPMYVATDRLIVQAILTDKHDRK